MAASTEDPSAAGSALEEIIKQLRRRAAIGQFGAARTPGNWFSNVPINA
jgi:hypothetical protein